jgi:hypothetical protein
MTGRTIVRVVPPTQSGPITRLIGTVDIDGSGTNHSLDQCDPFMLLDYAGEIKLSHALIVPDDTLTI